eukprot:scaffold20560_cov34-Tisochrysis_lutea.AAC.5
MDGRSHYHSRAPHRCPRTQWKHFSSPSLGVFEDSGSGAPDAQVSGESRDPRLKICENLIRRYCPGTAASFCALSSPSRTARGQRVPWPAQRRPREAQEGQLGQLRGQWAVEAADLARAPPASPMLAPPAPGWCVTVTGGFAWCAP